jgi:hypothetical protein
MAATGFQRVRLRERAIIIVGMQPMRDDHPIFSLQEAQQLLPEIKHLTADAVRQTESLASQLSGLTEEEPDYAVLSAAIKQVVNAWADQVHSLGLEAKGPWLVDFDNGEGYYCWCYPEATISHYHGYSDGFAGRVKIQ